MNRILSTTSALAGLLIAVASAQAAAPADSGRDHLYNGKSAHGSAVAAPQAARQVDIAASKTLNVACGETVTFRNGGKTFSWKFESAGHRAVDLRAIAPAGFADQAFMVYVSRNEAERT